jgi:hypothetical protein
LTLEQRPRPESPRRLLDDLGEQLLLTDGAAFVTRGDAFKERSGQISLLSKVEPRVTMVSLPTAKSLMILLGRGVVVMTACGLSPSRNPSIA